MIGHLAPPYRDRSLQSLFRTYQCGLCHHVGQTYGPVYRLLAGPDMVFLDVFLDLWADEPAVERRACVVAPLVTRLPTRVTTDNARFAAAFGVYMAVEKLRDDYQDEGGALRWLAWRALSRGHARARTVLVERGFPVESLEASMAEQARVEREETDLVRASLPTREIAAALFEHAGGHTPGLRALGDRVGAFLFYMDNLLDLGKDLREGGYNALARAGGLRTEDAVGEAAWTAGLTGAKAAVDDLEGLVRALPERPGRAYVAATLLTGFRDKIRRFEALSHEQRLRARLKDVLPSVPLRARVEASLSRPVSAANRVWARARWQLQATAALLVAWVLPRAALAEEWWPDTAGDPGLDTGVPDPILYETGSASDGSADCGSVCDPCAGNCGWISCNFDSVCGDPCGDACGSACSNACS